MNIDPPYGSLKDKKIVVATEQGVLALLQQGSGSAIWRTVLPRGLSLLSHRCIRRCKHISRFHLLRRPY